MLATRNRCKVHQTFTRHHIGSIESFPLIFRLPSLFYILFTLCTRTTQFLSWTDRDSLISAKHALFDWRVRLTRKIKGKRAHIYVGRGKFELISFYDWFFAIIINFVLWPLAYAEWTFQIRDFVVIICVCFFAFGVIVSPVAYLISRMVCARTILVYIIICTVR